MLSRCIGGIAVSESIPDSILVIFNKELKRHQGIYRYGDALPFIHLYPCQDASQPTKKFKIRGKSFTSLEQIVTNSSHAVIRYTCKSKSADGLVVFRLPQFSSQQFVQFPTFYDRLTNISINSEYLLVHFKTNEILIRSLSDLDTDLLWIDPPSQLEHFSRFVTSTFIGMHAFIVYGGTPSSKDPIVRTYERLTEPSKSFIQIFRLDIRGTGIKQAHYDEHNWGIDLPPPRAIEAISFSGRSNKFLTIVQTSASKKHIIKVYDLRDGFKTQPAVNRQ